MIETIEAGLLGVGPLPVHLHTGKPTPWSEGCVVRFTAQSGVTWIGNLQKGSGQTTKVTEWPEANAFVVVAKGAVYFTCPNEPNNWTFIDLLGIDCIVAPSRDLALLSTYTDVIAITPNRTERWRRSVANDGVEINKIENELVHGIAGISPPDQWHPFLLHLATGNDVERTE